MKLTYLACIKLADLPPQLLPLTSDNITKVIDVNGWTVAHQEMRMYGKEYWVTLERDVAAPAALHAACRIVGVGDTRVPE